MTRINNLQSTHFDQMPTNLHLLECVCTQLRMIWKDKEILVWKKRVVSEGSTIMLLTDTAACLMSSSQIDALKVNLENCFKKNSKRTYEVILKPEANCEIAVQIRMVYFEQMAQSSEDAGHPDDISTQATKEDELFILSISAIEHVAQRVEEETITVLNNCIQQLLEFNRLYYLLYQNSILLKKFRHDFRTPLTSVSMIGGILLTDENEELQQMGQMLHSATEKLDKLLKDFKSKLEL